MKRNSLEQEQEQTQRSPVFLYLRPAIWKCPTGQDLLRSMIKFFSPVSNISMACTELASWLCGSASYFPIQIEIIAVAGLAVLISFVLVPIKEKLGGSPAVEVGYCALIIWVLSISSGVR